MLNAKFAQLIFTLSLIYWSCWPSPAVLAQQTVGLFHYDSLAYPGYTLFTPNTETYLIDNCGKLINQWSSLHSPGLSAYLLINGNLLRAGRVPDGFSAPGAGGQLEIFSWEGDLLWSYRYADSTCQQHHDIEPLPNGHILILAWEIKTRAEAIQAGRDPEQTADVVWSEKIIELKPLGTDSAEIVWEWRLWDHLIQDFDPDKDNYASVAAHPELMDVNFKASGTPSNISLDWSHANALSYHPARDEIAWSSRNFSEIFIIDHSTSTEEAAGHSGGQAGKGGDLLYRWGNPMAYQRGTQEDQHFFGQHDVRWVPETFPNEGKIMVFNNGWGRPNGNFSTVDMIDPPLNDQRQYSLEAGEAFGPEELFWSYGNPALHSAIMSGAQALSNGNILICEASDLRFTEITANGQLVWDYISPAGNTGLVSQGNISYGDVFRATRYPEHYPAFDDRDLSPGEPLELDPWPYDCTIYNNQVSTRPILSPPEGIRLLRNPISENLELANPARQQLHIQVCDLGGKVVLKQYTFDVSPSFSTKNWPLGIYLLQVSDQAKKWFWVQKIVKMP